MAEEPDGTCGYTWPEDHEVGDDPDHQSCCYRDALEDTDRCAWHADPDDTSEKTIDALRDARVDADMRQQTRSVTSTGGTDLPIGPEPFKIIVGELLDGAILRGLELGNALPINRVALRYADLSAADLWEADLSDADLREADLSDADLRLAEFPDASFRDADLSAADLRGADLSDASLLGATLTDANMRSATARWARFVDVTAPDIDCTDADLLGASFEHAILRDGLLDGANLRGARLHDAKLRGASINDQTTFSARTVYEQEADPADQWHTLDGEHRRTLPTPTIPSGFSSTSTRAPCRIRSLSPFGQARRYSAV